MVQTSTSNSRSSIKQISIKLIKLNNLQIYGCLLAKLSRGVAEVLSAFQSWPFTPFRGRTPVRVRALSPRVLPRGRG